MLELHELVKRIARSSLPVLVLGETGAGKEVIAEEVHRNSPRASKPYVRVNCAALPATLIESELFGFERGAFTGAAHSKPGLIEAADGGTIFFDEIGEMPLETQPKLLRALESGEVTRIGAVEPRVVDVRVVAATNQPLAERVAQGTFRQDLYFRLNGITIPVRPLRERTAEIEALAEHLLARAAAREGRPAPALPPSVVAQLLRHPWPGNVRELRTVMERALALSAGGELRAEHVVLDAPPAAPPAPSRAGMAADSVAGGRLARIDPEEERRLIVQALEKTGGNQSRASEILGIARRTLIHRMDAYGIKRPRRRDGDD
jgi:transcriptional regulator with PAS, ATPase and Fis domain